MLTEAEEREYLALQEAEYGGESLTDYICRVAPREPPPPHLSELLIPVLERARTEPMRVIIEWPPRHAKSTTLMRALMWELEREPALLSAYIAYQAEQAEEPSRKMRQMARGAGLRLAEDSQAVNFWHTPQGGGLVATGINGPLTGKGIGGWLVVDDPHKDRAEAESRLKRDRAWDWLASTAYSRLEGIASVIVSMQRWHQDDMVGRLLRGDLGDEKWHVIEMPALTDIRTGEAAGDECPDEFLRALWPEHFPVERLKKIRSAVQPYNWWSQYQQQPRARGAEIFHEPARFNLATTKLEGYRLIWAADPAATAKTSADYSVAVLLAVKGYGDDAVAYVLDVVRIQVQVPTFVRNLAQLARKRGCGVVVEAVGGFKAVPQMLRELAPGLRVVEVKPSADKFTRAQSLAGAWNMGRIRVPEDAPWAEVFIDEFRSFTGVGDVHDDQIDATGHAWDALYVPMPKTRGQRAASYLPFG